MTQEAFLTGDLKEKQKESDVKSENNSIINLNESCQGIVEDQNKLYIGNLNEAALFVRDNDYIRTGYRINCHTMGRIFKSLIMCHNETTNIWSHLGGFILFVLFTLYIAMCISPYELKSPIESEEVQSSASTMLFRAIFHMHYSPCQVGYQKIQVGDGDGSEQYCSLYESLSDIVGVIGNFTQQALDQLTDGMETVPEQIKRHLRIEKEYISSEAENSETPQLGLSRWPMFLHMAGALTCLLFSCSFHLMLAHSEKILKFFSRMDYSGIAILISGSTFPPIVYGFACSPTIKYTYIILISSFCSLAFIVTMMPNSDKPGLRKFRGFLFIIVGLLAGVPAVHGAVSSDPNVLVKMFYWVMGGIIYIAGALIYVARIPERCCPKTFDYFGQSHNLFHLFVLIAAITHYIGSLECYYERKHHSCPVI